MRELSGRLIALPTLVTIQRHLSRRTDGMRAGPVKAADPAIREQGNRFASVADENDSYSGRQEAAATVDQSGGDDRDAAQDQRTRLGNRHCGDKIAVGV